MINNCKFCGMEFEWDSRQKKYCSQDCKARGLALREKKIMTFNCRVCGIEFNSSSSKAVFCSEDCKKSWVKDNPKINSYDLICKNCGIEFKREMKGRTSRNENCFCSISCSGKYKNREGVNSSYECRECGITFKQKHKRHFFCSESCKRVYGTKNVIMKDVACSNCGKSIERPRSLVRDNFFCDRICESTFRQKQSEDKRICRYCGKEFVCKKHDKLVFCSKSCQICGMNKSPTRPHILINDFLDQLGLNFEIESPIKRYSMDIFLKDFNLYIEIMGKYWHCDNRIYNEPMYKAQIDGIKKDKKKSEFLKGVGARVLYLWEDDVNDRIEVCRSLIVSFIENRGVFDNYHSMNYSLNKDGILSLNEIVLAPYFER